MKPGLRPGASGSSPGPCLLLSWTREEPGAEQLSGGEGARALDAGAGPGAEAKQRLLWGRDGAGRGGDAAPRTEVRKLPESRGELVKLCAHRGDGRLGQSPVQGAAGRVPGARGISSRGARVRARAREWGSGVGGGAAVAFRRLADPCLDLPFRT